MPGNSLLVEVSQYWKKRKVATIGGITYITFSWFVDVGIHGILNSLNISNVSLRIPNTFNY